MSEVGHYSVLTGKVPTKGWTECAQEVLQLVRADLLYLKFPI